MTKFEQVNVLATEAQTAETLYYRAEKYAEAIQLAREIEKPRLLAVLFLQWGLTFQQVSNVQSAVIAFEEGFKALTDLGDVSLERLYSTMRAVEQGKTYEYKPLGSYATVLPDLYWATVSADLATAIADPLLATKLLINIGNAYLRMPQLNPAMSRYKMALAREEIGESAELRAIAHTHLGLIHSRRNKVEHAAQAVETALPLFAPNMERNALVILAGIRKQQEQPAAAVQLYQQAHALYQAAGDITGEQRALANWGHFEWQNGDIEQAEQRLNAALALDPDAQDAHIHRYIHWALGECQRKKGNRKAATASLQTSLEWVKSHQKDLTTDEGDIAFLDSVQEIYDALIATKLAQVVAGEIGFEEFLDVIDDNRSRELYKLRQSRKTKQHHRGYSKIGPPQRMRPSYEQTAAAIAALNIGNLIEAAYSVAPTALTPSPSPSGRGESISTDLASLPVSLEEEGSGKAAETSLQPMARLVYYVLPEQTIVMGISIENQCKGHIIPISEAKLDEHIADLRAALRIDSPPRMQIERNVRLRRSERSGAVSDPRELLQTLYSLLVAPVADVLPNDGLTPIAIEPHRGLWLLPFAALRAGEAGWFADRAPLLYTPAHKVLKAIRQERDFAPAKTLRALIVADPKMPTVPERDGLTITLNQLSGAKEEARSVGVQFAEGKRTYYVGEDATITAVADALPHHQVIHLATHGLTYADDPNKSFIALADDGDKSGIFTVADALQLPHVAADLVTLSACQTGLGKISADGIIGLGRAFLALGARSVLVSQWNVNDWATAHLMTAFYHFYCELDNKALALYHAMREYRQQHSDDPRNWASFILIGSET